MTATQMDAIEIAEFLAARETGVLSLADGGEGYGVPVAFSYEHEEPAVYFRLGYGPGSHKRSFVEATDRACFAVYGRTDAGWKSVLAQGPLEVCSEGDLDAAVVEAARGLEIPYFRVHDRPADDLSFEIVRLEPATLSGIVAGD